jgi:putative protein kinase ArgK-like GTPase of G3E family
MGDDVQAIKAGILEIADIFAINKSDQPGADRVERELEAMLSLPTAASPDRENRSHHRRRNRELTCEAVQAAPNRAAAATVRERSIPLHVTNLNESHRRLPIGGSRPRIESGPEGQESYHRAPTRAYY